MQRYVIETNKVKVIINKGISFAYKGEIDLSEEENALQEASKIVREFLKKENIIFKVTYTEDNDLEYWINEEADSYKFRMSDIDLSNQLVWTRDCPYAIDIDSIMIL